jgi:hypothetical protein
MSKNNKIKLKVILEANKILRLSRPLQNQHLKDLKIKFEETHDTKTGMLIELLVQKQQQLDLVADNMIHGGEL